MVFALAVLSNILLASAALAAPRSLGDRLARRRASRQSQPNQRIDSDFESLAANASQVSYSTNWAGAVWDSYPAGTFTSVTGTFTVPTPKGADGSASAWVGIDGDTCGSAILQTGIDFTVSGGEVSYDAWYEWYPDYAHDFSGLDISSGDEIKITVTASTTKAGKAIIQNLSTGQTVSKSLTSSSALCEQNAEWIVEDFEESGGLVPFANFGTVKFTNAVATIASGGSAGPAGATLIDIKQNNKVLTTVSTSSSGLTVSYV
ncbi:hypothetical protein GALMADRAFT_280571 [Galerina marginata CBS 339.88]|uniref:Aspergillopepsin-2 n=1 Tax=Galerina marginata (strain CBS 339.88) TaxID=685588 RepID=A0A067T4Y1_GALM3|nr:hypothetical protein GALMADRAFT_280571 [Galerina marginata CBS 339.88]